MKFFVILFAAIIGSLAVAGFLLPPTTEGTSPATDRQKNFYQNNLPSGIGQSDRGTAMPSCGTDYTLLSVLPVPLSYAVTMTPVGQFSPPDHVFPAPHAYIYVLDYRDIKDVEAPLYSPGDMTLTDIGLRHYNKFGEKTDYVDYTLVFSVCSEFQLYFHHVRSLTYAPFAKEAQKILSGCKFSETRNEDYCSGRVGIPIGAGEQIGTVGDSSAGVYGVDIGARDSRLAAGRDFVDPPRLCSGGNVFDRCYTVCPYDYLPADVESQIIFSDGSSGTVRTDEPVCGDLYNDVAGTAQGYWFGSGQDQFSPESNSLFLGPDTVQPSTVEVFSVGNSVPTLQAGLYRFRLASSGSVNRDFKDVVPDGGVYCYDSLSGVREGENLAGRILLQMADQDTVRIEGQETEGCGSGPWSLGQGYSEFER